MGPAPDTLTAGLPWEPAPATSHIHSWRFYDARKFTFLHKFGDEAFRGQSQLQVRFRVRGGAGLPYVYHFADHDAGAGYHAALKAEAHPGHVVGQLKAAGVPFTRS